MSDIVQKAVNDQVYERRVAMEEKNYELFEYYRIEDIEGNDHLMILGKSESGHNVLVRTFERDEEEAAFDLINKMGKSPNYMWDMHGTAKILRKCVKEVVKKRKTGDRFPFYYAVLFDGEEFPILAALE